MDTNGWRLPERLALTYKQAIAGQGSSVGPDGSAMGHDLVIPTLHVTESDLDEFRANRSDGRALLNLEMVIEQAMSKALSNLAPVSDRED